MAGSLARLIRSPGRSIAAAMRRLAWRMLGMIALAIGMIGIALPGLPTVPFLILAAFCFARADPRLEQWLVDHPRFGPHIRAWRARGAIRRSAKRLATAMLAASIALSAVMVGFPWAIAPIAAALGAGAFIWTRPDG